MKGNRTVSLGDVPNGKQARLTADMNRVNGG